MERYPSQSGKWSWDEVEMLEQVLGFHGKIFYCNVPVDKKIQPNLTTKEIYILLESDIFYPHVHKTFNVHNGSYNIKVFMKAVELLSQRLMSFAELHTARVAFQTYEHKDQAGLEDKLLLRAMKLCGKTMSPQRLTYSLRHLNRLVTDRVMLYEFLELLMSADHTSVVTKELPKKKSVKETTDRRHLYDLCDFKEELITHDERCYNFLDKAFEESLKIIPVKATSKTSEQLLNTPRQWAKPPLANTSIRKEMTSKNKCQSEILEKYLTSSDATVKLCRCGESCSCTADVSGEAKSNKIKVFPSDEDGVNDISINANIDQDVPIKKKHFVDIVKEEEVKETSQQIQNIQWQIATHKQQMKKRLESRKSTKKRD
ncbi:uncharacterized protein LOC130628581 [Hydractinia symbiolongicarpus]|uniref:uncharacterized protein LOC130628581 n=1 Tax=Hydractinia symbiolongicarpus TaxID=13093 RepID=UPI00254A29F1|nr:uncharacterized protein LOC130628581 [Hydractinia symbiolongicarpus]